MDVKLTNESLASKLEGVIAKLEEELSIKRNQMDELMKLVNNLDDVDQRIVKLRYVKGYTFEEIAEAMDYSVGHIRNRHSNIRKCIEFVENYQDEITYYRSETPN
ncbi:RNA polymerase sigma factor [Globicatella sanguinis]